MGLNLENYSYVLPRQFKRQSQLRTVSKIDTTTQETIICTGLFVNAVVDHSQGRFADEMSIIYATWIECTFKICYINTDYNMKQYSAYLSSN